MTSARREIHQTVRDGRTPALISRLSGHSLPATLYELRTLEARGAIESRRINGVEQFFRLQPGESDAPRPDGIEQWPWDPPDPPF